MIVSLFFLDHVMCLSNILTNEYQTKNVQYAKYLL